MQADSAIFRHTCQSQIKDFPKEGAPFVRSAKSTRFSGGGGGVVAEFFRGLRNPTRFSGWGGGVVAEMFRRGGPGHQKAGSTTNFALMRHFVIFRLSKRGGPAGPPGPPPPESATACSALNMFYKAIFKQTFSSSLVFSRPHNCQICLFV